MRTRALAGWLTAAFVALLLQPLTAQDQPGILNRVEFSTTDGRRLSLEELRGKVVLLDFWATWCAPCLAEIPRLRRLHEELEEAGLVIIGVSLDAMETRRFVSWTQRQDVTWPQVRDGRSYAGDLPRMFDIDQLPSTVLFDHQGRIAARDLRGARLERAIRELLAGIGRD